MQPIIAFSSDFGLDSTYVAQMKGVALSICPDARLVDVVHTLPAHDIKQAEARLRAAFFAFPLGTVHVMVVDPGVGTARRGLAVRARGMTFVAPDNGLLGAVVRQSGAEVRALDAPALYREPLSPTFHGRDVFTPVAAELAAGLPFESVGPPIDDPVPSQVPPPTSPRSNTLLGVTLTADTFGNLATNIPMTALTGASAGAWSFQLADEAVSWVRTYADAPEDAVVALAGSDGYLEFALRGQSLARRLNGCDFEVRCVRRM